MADEPTIDELCQRARKLLKSGRAREALAVFEEARQLNDLDPDVHDGLATAHCLLGEFEPAAKHFDLVTRLDPRRSAAWINLGAVYNRLRNFSRAAEVLRRAVQIAPQSDSAHYNLGTALRNQDRLEEAVASFRHAICANPANAEAHYNLANALRDLNRPAEAEASYRDALGVPLPPGLPDALLVPAKDPLGDLVSRYARTHAPFTTEEVAARFGLPVARIEAVLETLVRRGRLVEGAFRPGGTRREWCDVDVLAVVRRHCPDPSSAGSPAPA